VESDDSDNSPLRYELQELDNPSLGGKDHDILEARAQMECGLPVRQRSSTLKLMQTIHWSETIDFFPQYNIQCTTAAGPAKRRSVLWHVGYPSKTATGRKYRLVTAFQVLPACDLISVTH